MSADLNRVTLVGRLTRDPEVAYTRAGDPVTTLRVAVSSRAKDPDGTWTDRPNYFDVVVWGRQAEAAGEHLAKGRRIGVDGRLSWREWLAEDGSRRQAVEVVAGDVYYLDSRREREGQERERPGAPAQDGAAPRAPQPVATGAAASDDDIPF